jgi:ferritin-like metal-binding protein YciE
MAAAPKRDEASAELIRTYLEDAIGTAKRFETQLRQFAREGDDEDVQAAFSAYAEEARQQHERLAGRLEQLGGRTEEAVRAPVGAIEPASQIPQEEHIREEGTVQHLVAAYAAESGECALYNVLASIAAAAGDRATEALSREIQEEKEKSAKRVFGFIRSRSKIAYNMLTPNELDPAIETKAFDNRVI